MGLLDTLLGRSRPKPNNLDALFAVPNAALTLESAAGFLPTGEGAVCFRAAEGTAFAQVQADVQALLDADAGPKVAVTQDSFGFTWLVVRAPEAAGTAGDVSAVVTDLHAVNTALEAAGFGSALLCSVAGFRHPDGRVLGLVYLYKRGSFYPFAPVAGGGQRRDNALELQIRASLGADLPVESDLSRWFPVWGAPGL